MGEVHENRFSGSRGFTVLELAVSMVIGAVIVSVLIMSLKTGEGATNSLGTGMDQTEDLRRCLRRMADELRTASVTAEDTNASSALDAGEDRNGNGRLDADWAITSNSITFNRMVGPGVYSLPITYRRVGSDLVRDEWTDTAGKMISASIVTSVDSFTVTQAGRKITLALGLSKTTKDGQIVSETQSISVAPRN